LQESSPAAKAVTLGAKVLGVASLAVDIPIRCVAAQDRVKRPLALAAGEAFLEKEKYL